MTERTPDATVAQAIDRVLAAESEAASAIASAQREAEAMIEAARGRRRSILETTRQRATRLHAQARVRLQRGLEAMEHDATGSDTEAEKLRRLSRLALENLARRLTGADRGAP